MDWFHKPSDWKHTHMHTVTASQRADLAKRTASWTQQERDKAALFISTHTPKESPSSVADDHVTNPAAAPVHVIVPPMVLEANAAVPTDKPGTSKGDMHTGFDFTSPLFLLGMGVVVIFLFKRM